MRAAALVVVASALAGCNASLDLGGNDDPAGGGGGADVTTTTGNGGGDGATSPSTSASSAGGDAGGGGSTSTSSGGGGPGGGAPLGACEVPAGAIEPEPIFEVPGTVTNAFAVGDTRLSLIHI